MERLKHWDYPVPVAAATIQARKRCARDVETVSAFSLRDSW